MGGTPGQLPLREAPQRKRNIRPVPSTLPKDGAVAPNAPQSQRAPRKKPQSRMSFRRFVDTTMAGIANFIPRMRRRSSNRRRFVRDAEVSPSSPPTSESPSMMSRWDGPSPSLPESLSSPSSSSSSSSPPASSSKGIHVTVNVFHGHPVGAADGAGVPGPAPLDSLTVSHYSNHTVDLQHSYTDGGADGGPHSHLEPLSLSQHMPHSSETPLEPVSWPPLSYLDSFTPPKFPSFTDFLDGLDQEQGWQENPQGTADIPGYTPVTPGTPSSHYPAEGTDEEYQISTAEGIDVGVTNDVHAYPDQNKGRPDFHMGNRINRTSYTNEGNLHHGGEGVYPAGGGSYSTGQGSYSAGGVSFPDKGGSFSVGGDSYSTGEGSYSAGGGSFPGGGSYIGEGQDGSSLVSQVVGAGQAVQAGGNAGCGMRCLWNDLMKYLDHYSSTKDKEASLRAPLTQTHPHHRPYRPPQHQGKAHTRPTNTATPLATNTNRRHPTFRQRPHPRPPRKPTVVRDKSKSSPPPLLHPGPPYSSRPVSSSGHGRRLAHWG